MRRNGKRTFWLITGAIVGAAAGRLYYGNIDPPAENIPAQTLPTPNAFDTYTEAFEKLPQKINPKPYKDIPALSLEQRQAALEADAEGLRLARLAQTQPMAFPRPKNFTDPIAFSHFANYRSLARLYVVEGETRLETGDESGAMNSFLDAVAMGQQQQSSGTMISRLVGMACQGIGRKFIWERLDSWSGDAAKTGARRMETINAAYTPMSVNFTEEKMIGISTLTALMSDPKAFYTSLRSGQEVVDAITPDGEAKAERDPTNGELFLRQQLGLFVFPKRDVLRNYKINMDAAIAQANLPYAKRGATPNLSFDPITQMLIPVFAEGTFNDDGQKTQNALLTVALSLQAYKAERGAYPENLNEICPAYLTRLPADPFSADGATPPLYRRTPDKYVLYSIGPDGKDDGGKIIENAGRPHRKSPRSSMTPQSKGDIVAWENQF